MQKIALSQIFSTQPEVDIIHSFENAKGTDEEELLLTQICALAALSVRMFIE